MSTKRKIFYFAIISVVGVCGLLSIVLSKTPESEQLVFVGLDSVDARRPSAKSLVMITHGWIEKGKGDWPEDMAQAIQKRVDPNFWLCGYFDWSKGAGTINPTDAAEYGRDKAGEILAKKIISIDGDIKHIHLVGHSSGCWAISEAAKVVAQKTKADIHLTFLDAYVPMDWEESSLGDVNIPADANFWAEHYYTKDYTLGFTEKDLTYAHNVNVTEVDQFIKDHKFPWKWYYATITGKFPKWSLMDDKKLVVSANGIKYGFARSKEASKTEGWCESLKLKTGNKAVKLKKHQNKKK